MTETETPHELHWARDRVTGQWHACGDDGVTYTAGRSPRHTSGRPDWFLTALHPERLGQERTGFSSLRLAQAAALNTRCHRCGRHRPFAAMEGEDSIKDWHCRDREECDRAAAGRDAESRRITSEIRNTPWAGCEVRDTRDGPELVIHTSERDATSVQATELDIMRLTRMLLRRWLDAGEQQ
jgi:hypothetical protein